MPTIHYATPAMRLGHHDWRCIVIPSEYTGLTGNQRCTDYQWRPASRSDVPWQHLHAWPAYDFNHDNYGMPAGIARLYARHERDIKAALAGEPALPLFTA